MRFGLIEHIGFFPGGIIKVAPFEADPVGFIAGLASRGPTDEEWLAAMRSLRLSLNSEIGRFFTGQVDAASFGENVYTQLLRGHAVNVAAGRMRAGALGALNETDRQVALFHGQQQGAFLEGFVRRLNEKEPRYWDADKGEWKKGVISRDLQMYASRYRGSANISFEANSPDDALFFWRLGAAEHCQDCLDLASENPHHKGELPVFPGDGGTDCKVNCKCWLERGDGVKGFKPDPGVGKWIPDENNDSPPSPSPTGEPTQSVIHSEGEETAVLPSFSVSSAMRYRGETTAPTIKEAHALIDAVHSDGLLPKVVCGDFIEDGANEAEGWFIPSAEIQRTSGKSFGLLNLNPNAAHPLMTVAHETGHVLEIELYGADAIVMGGAQNWLRVSEALQESDAVQNLLRIKYYIGEKIAEARANRDWDAADYFVGFQGHVLYLLRPAEIWARAYAQFIATKAVSPKMKKELRESIEDCRKSGIWRQWEKEEFEEISIEITAAMVAEGWIE